MYNDWDKHEARTLRGSENFPDADAGVVQMFWNVNTRNQLPITLGLSSLNVFTLKRHSGYYTATTTFDSSAINMAQYPRCIIGTSVDSVMNS